MNRSVLTNVELVAVVVAFAADLLAILLRPPVLARLELSLVAGLAGAVATFMLPVSAHRRWPALAVALLALPAIGCANPRVGLTGLVLAVVLVIRCTLAFGLRGTAIASCSAIVMVALGVMQQLPPLMASVTIAIVCVCFGSIFGCVGFLANTLRNEGRMRRELERANARLREYEAQAIEHATLEERARVARELHDALGHGLTTLRVQLQSAVRLRGTDDDKADAFVQLASGSASSLLTDLRETVAILRPAETAEPFTMLVERVLADFARIGALEVTWNIDVAREPAPIIGTALTRVVQEALTNVVRHARATQVNASIRGDEESIAMKIADDGCGFKSMNPGRGTGLRSMRERLAALAGSVAIDSADGGTTVRVTVPLNGTSCASF